MIVYEITFPECYIISYSHKDIKKRFFLMDNVSQSLSVFLDHEKIDPRTHDRHWVILHKFCGFPLFSGVNFTNILRAAFTHADPKSAKKTVKLSSFLCFWDL